MKPRRDAAVRRRISPYQLVCIVIAVLIGGAIYSKRVQARPLGVLGAPIGSALRGLSIAAASAPAAAASSAPAPAASAAPGDDDVDPIDMAILRDEKRDLPPNLTEWQKLQLDVGVPGVLIQRDGEYRSPFSNPKFGAPARVRVGFVLNDVRDYDIQKGSFQADFYIALVSDKPMPAKLNLSFSNGHEDSSVKLADKPTFKLYRYIGQFESDVDLRKFPFDSQHLRIEFEAENIGVDQVIFEPDHEHTELDSGFFIPGWDVARLGATSYQHYYPPRFPHDDLYYSRYAFDLGLDRFGTSAIFSVYVPALVIVLISLIAMWVPPTEMEVRTNAGAPMLVGAVLFHFSLMQELPATGYLTRADKLMIAVYGCLMLNMISTWIFFLIDEEHHEKAFKWSRAIVPSISVLLVLLGTTA